MLVALSLAPDGAAAQFTDIRGSGDAPPDSATLAEVRADTDGAIRRFLEFLGPWAPEDTTLVVHAYGSAPAKARATGDERPFHLDGEGLHVVATDEVRGHRMGGHVGAFAARGLSEASLPILETGLPVFFSEGWGGRGFEYWAGHLYRAGLVPELARVLSEDWLDQASPFVAEPVAGLLVAHLIGRWAREGFLERYPSWRPTDSEIAAMEPGWRAFLDAVEREHGPAISDDRDRRRLQAREIPLPLRGVNYAHEGYRGFGGYLSQRSELSLHRLYEMGANAVAVLPYTFMSAPDQPTELRVPARAGSETDDAVIHAIRSAERLNMTVLLKPHVWLRGSWPGEIRMASTGDWDRFFESYERWILHYALMAEIHEVPILSVGVEMSAATLGREARWRELVARVRSVYSGALVYAANWGEEFENLGFWDAFDYLGVDAYYPLSDDPAAPDEELLRGARAMLDRVQRVHRRFDKPVLFTEIGFASTRGSWLRPWEGHLEEVADPSHQLRSYRAVTRAMEGRDWIGGVLWWEWPSDLRRAERDRRGYMPVGKPVEAALAEWFRGADPDSPAPSR